MIELNSTIKIHKVKCSSLDLDVLSQMYLPIINNDGLSLYIGLNNQAKDEVTVLSLLDQFSFQNISFLHKALYKLEAIGLVKEYAKEGSPSIVELIPPLSPKAFLNNPFLKNVLINKIGEVEYGNLRSMYFKKSSFRGYTEVTKAFDEVYKRTKGQVLILSNQTEEEDNIKIRNSGFDYSFFKLLFDNEIDKDVLNDKVFEDAIIKISYQYELNEQEMKEAVVRAITIGEDFDLEKISMHAGYIYQNKEDHSKVNFVPREAHVTVNNFDDGDLKLIAMCKNKSISQVLRFATGANGSLADVRDFNRLQEQTGLSIGVVNALVIYLCAVKKGENLSYTYIEKVAKNWIKSNVTTVEDAFTIIKEAKEKRDNPMKGKVAPIPEWMNEENEVKETKEEEVKLDDKDITDLKKKLFGDDDE